MGAQGRAWDGCTGMGAEGWAWDRCLCEEPVSQTISAPGECRIPAGFISDRCTQMGTRSGPWAGNRQHPASRGIGLSPGTKPSSLPLPLPLAVRRNGSQRGRIRILWRICEHARTGGVIARPNAKKPLTVNLNTYDSQMQYGVSDHKPVLGTFSLELEKRFLEPLVELQPEGEWVPGIDAIICYYTAHDYPSSSWDWIGLYKVGFRSGRDYMTYVWVKDDELTVQEDVYQVYLNGENVPEGGGDLHPLLLQQQLGGHCRSQPVLPGSPIPGWHWGVRERRTVAGEMAPGTAADGAGGERWAASLGHWLRPVPTPSSNLLPPPWGGDADTPPLPSTLAEPSHPRSNRPSHTDPIRAGGG
ncbi:uncharacterized protein LOC144606362 [Rhinoraja longicauda]